MIVKCKICGGNEFVSSGNVFDVFGQNRKPCPLCKGAGEIDLNVPKERLTTCKFCAGRGLISSSSTLMSTMTICPTCKGLGLLERLQIGGQQVTKAKTETTTSVRPIDSQYDLAISFAGEDRHIVQSYVILTLKLIVITLNFKVNKCLIM
jgi:DnaJ-class molecular chaperone